MDFDNLTFRHLTRQDATSMHRTLRAAEDDSPIPVVTSLDDLLREFDEPNHTLEADTLGAFTPSGDVAGYIWSSLRPNPTRLRAAEVHGRIHPAWARRGLGTHLIDWAIERGRRRLAEVPDDLPKVLRAHLYEEDVAAVAAFTACGFAPTRYYIEMDRDLSEPIEPRDPPPGVRVVPFSADLDERIRLTHNAAFTDHWGSEPLTAERWVRWLSGNEHFLADTSFVALAGDEVVGYATNSAYPDEFEQLGHTAAWIAALGTSREWRRRGIASLMIATSLAGFAAVGYDRAWLGVDSANPTGALDLYRRHGFRAVRREIAFMIRISGDVTSH